MLFLFLISKNLKLFLSLFLSSNLLRHLADLVYNLFAPTQDANINATLVLDQLEGTLNRQCSTINEHEELLDLDTKLSGGDKIKSEDSDSVNSYKLDTMSIQSLDIFSDAKRSQVKLPTSKTSGSLKDLSKIDSDSSESSKPDLIHIRELRKAFWSRKNKFHLKRFGFLRKKQPSSVDSNNPGSDPKLGAIVSLAALAAGMTSFPIVHQHQDPKEESQNETLNEKEEENPNLDQDTKVLTEPKILEEKAKTPVEEELEISMLCSKLEHEMHELEKLEQEVEQAELKNQPFYHPDLMTTINRSKTMQIPNYDTNRSELIQNPNDDTNRSKPNPGEQNKKDELQTDAKNDDAKPKPGFKIPPRLQRQKSMPSIDSLVMFTEGSETWL